LQSTCVSIRKQWVTNAGKDVNNKEIHSVGGMQSSATPTEISMEIHQKAKNRFTL
jgi:hypothetical protein